MNELGVYQRRVASCTLAGLRAASDRPHAARRTRQAARRTPHATGGTPHATGGTPHATQSGDAPLGRLVERGNRLDQLLREVRGVAVQQPDPLQLLDLAQGPQQLGEPPRVGRAPVAAVLVRVLRDETLVERFDIEPYSDFSAK